MSILQTQGMEAAKEGGNQPENVRIYLEIPKLKKDEFKIEILKLKRDGAVFDLEKKAWYIFPGEEEKFQKYLPSAEKVPDRESERIYLRLPWVSKDEFKELTKQLKDNGAVFDGKEKKWFIQSGQKEKFQAYLESDIKQPANPDQNAMANYHTLSPIGLMCANSVNVYYEFVLLDGRKIRMDEAEIKRLTGINNSIQMLAGDVVGAMEKKIAELTRFIKTDKEYDIVVGKDMSDNTCFVVFHDENRPPIKLFGEQYNVYFPSLSTKEINEVVENHIIEKESKRNESKEKFKVGEQVSVSIPKYTFVRETESYISNIGDVKGIIQCIDQDEKRGLKTFTIENEKGVYSFVDSNEIYDPLQTRILKAAREKLTVEQFAVLAKPGLSAEKMEVVYQGLREGLSLRQVANYARPEIETWQMHLYRYGQLNQVPFPDLKRCIQDCMNSNGRWKAGLKAVDNQIKEVQLIIREVERNGFHPSSKVIKGMLELNRITQKQHTIMDVSIALKNGVYTGKAGEVIKEVGNIFRNQELQKIPMFCQVPGG